MAQNKLIVVKIHHGSLSKMLGTALFGVGSNDCARKTDGTNLPKQWLQRPSFQEDRVDVVKVGEVGINLQYPVGPTEHDSDDVDARDSARQKRAILHPGDDVVESPADVETDSSDTEIPTISRRVGEYESTVSHSQDQLQPVSIKSSELMQL